MTASPFKIRNGLWLNNGTSSPSIVGRTDANSQNGLALTAYVPDAANSGDMQFQIKQNNGSAFSTLTNDAFTWYADYILGKITRAGAWALGPPSANNASLGQAHTINGHLWAGGTDGSNAGDKQLIIGTNAYVAALSRTGRISTATAGCCLVFQNTATTTASVFDVQVNKIGDALNTGTITALRVTQDGQVLTGYASSAAPMGLAPRADNASTLGGASNRWSEIYCTNATINTSDIRDKDNIVDTDLGLNYIIKLRPVSYKWKDRVRTHQGLIAQEVEQVIHDLGKTTQDVAAFIIADTKDEDGNIVGDRYGLRYGEFIAPLIKSVQELNDRITALENK